MQSRQLTNTALVVLVALLPGCATQRGEMGQGEVGKSVGVSNITPADPHLDHIFAWIPRDRAQTASVAKALVYIELGRAKEEVSTILCGGDWLINSASVNSIGPYTATAPVILGGYPAWYFHVSHKPGLAGCPAMPAETLYRELGNRLPPWITVRAASPQLSENPGAAIAVILPEH